MILSENGRPVTAAALGIPIDPSVVDAPLTIGFADLPEDAIPDDLSQNSEKEVAESTVTAVSFPGGGSVVPIAELEKQAILVALQQTEGNKTQAAGLLGISIRTLRNKLQEYRSTGTSIPFSESD